MYLANIVSERDPWNTNRNCSISMTSLQVDTFLAYPSISLSFGGSSYFSDTVNKTTYVVITVYNIRAVLKCQAPMVEIITR